MFGEGGPKGAGGRPEEPGSDGRFAAGAFMLFAGLAVAMTWPLARAPHLLLHGNADVYGNVWAMSWVARQLPRDPLHLFDANMYFPHPGSLAYAESLVPQGLQAMLVGAFGGGPVLAYNLVLLLTFPVAGLGAALLARDLGAARGPAVLCGLGYAFCTYRWDHVVHVQSLSCGWLPLALWCLRRTLRGDRPRVSAALGLGVFAWLQVLSSGYYALVVAAAVAVVGGVEAVRSLRETRRLPPGLVPAGLALALAAIAALPVFWSHRQVMERHGFRRTVSEMRVWSAGPKSWVDPGAYGGLPHARWLHRRFEDREPLFPGSVFLLGGLAALGLLAARREAALVSAAALTLLGVLLASGAEWSIAGSTWPGPFRAIRLLPGGDLLRTPSRFGVLGVLGLDLLAALAFIAMARAWGAGGGPSRWRGRAFVVGLGLFAVAEAWPAGLATLVKPAPPAPPATAWLASAPEGPVLELPWTEPTQGAFHVFWSTAHWQRLVSGYGSFDPPGNFALGLLGQRFPTEYTARALRAAGIRYVVVHLDRLEAERRARVEGAPLPEGVSLAADLGEDRVYEIDPSGPRPRGLTP